MKLTRKTLTFLAGTLLVLTGCAGTGSPTREVEFVGEQARLQHADGKTEEGLALRYVTPETSYGVQGVVGIGESRGSNDFGPFRLDATRVSGDLGFRLVRDLGPARLYMGAGLAPEYLEVQDTAGERDHALAVAGYGAVGAKLRLGGNLSVGAEYRITSGARFHLLDSTGVDMDTHALALTIGWGF